MGRVRAITALLILGPWTPMLFQGQEFAASTPFLYFADHTPELAELVAKGRSEFLKQFPSIATPEAEAVLHDPEDPETFEKCKLNFEDRIEHQEIYRFHRDLIQMRKNDPVFRSIRRGSFDGAVLGLSCFLFRFFGQNGDDRLLLVNLGNNQPFDPNPEPLAAPPLNSSWDLRWSSEAPHYGGCGNPPFTEENWQIPARATVVLAPISKSNG